MSKSIPHTILQRIGDGKMNQLIDTIERTANHLEAHPFANMKVLPAETFPVAFANHRVFHGLGYPLTGYWIVNTQFNVNIAMVAGGEAVDPNNYAVFQTSLASIVTLAVF